jgi:dihydrofolate reductase/thymidylate synthase
MLIVKDMAATAIVAASASTRGIGRAGELPWPMLKEDMKHFARVTRGANANANVGGKSSAGASTSTINAVVMGRKTWESIPRQHRPLKGRTNVVLTRESPENIGTESSSSLAATSNDEPGSASGTGTVVLTASSLAEAWQKLAARDDLGEIFVIGGATIYEQAISQDYVQKIIYTRIETPPGMEFDTFFPNVLENDGSGMWKRSEEEGEVEDPTASSSNTYTEHGMSYSFETYVKTNTEEEQYLNLIRHILDHGSVRGDRTGTGTKSVFGAQMRFDLRNNRLPLLTTKKTFWRGVAEELLWFISGSTNANLLRDKDIHIWDGNASKEFLESRGLGHREEGDLGPVYGFQWRHFGAEYQDVHTDYTGRGVDQLQQCIDKIMRSPEDRRILLTAWNPCALDEMALPPCHLMCQFYVDIERGELSCHMYQRSADMGLGVPFNIASYALLTHLVAHVCGLQAGDLVHSLGDAHVYLNHIGPLQEQLARTPRPFPKLYIDPHGMKAATNGFGSGNIDGFEYGDLLVVGYNPHKAISMKMAV